jgi:hypothetical protein
VKSWWNGIIITVQAVGLVFFPLDKQWALSSSRLSGGMSQQVVWLSGLLPYQAVQAVLHHTRQPVLPVTSIWEEVQRQGERLVEQAGREREQVNVERTQWDHQRYNPLQAKSISMDGGMIYLRGEGWKELKAGVVADLEHHWHRADQPVFQLKNLHYMAVIEKVSAFTQAFWAFAYQRGVTYAGRIVVTADGAPWIWRIAHDLFPTALQIVDWYHATQHLALAAHARYPADDTLAQRWYAQMKNHLFQGEIHCILTDLHAHSLSAHATYFVTHQRRMQYQAFRADGYPIGSGAIESGIKRYKQRFTGAGMRWSRAGAERMILIRSAILSDQFDTLWQAA